MLLLQDEGPLVTWLSAYRPGQITMASAAEKAALESNYLEARSNSYALGFGSSHQVASGPSQDLDSGSGLL